MEITQIDGEGTLLEETLETLSAGADVDIDTDVSEQGDFLESSDTFILESSGNLLSESDPVVTPDGLADSERSEEAADPEEGTEEQTGEEEEEQEETVDSALPGASPSPTLLLSDEPLAVYLVEQPEETIDMQSLDGSPYPGTISSTYLDYFSGIVDKLGYNEHYVAYRSGQYEYILAWGEGLEYDLAQFKGSALSYCRIYRANNNYSDYYVEFGNDTVYLTPGTGFVYSDLGDFATLTEGGTHLEMLTLLFAVGFAVVYSVCHDLFDYVMEHVYRK